MRRSLFLLDFPECPKDTIGGVEWSPTAGGSKDIKPCPNGALGTATRTCAGKGIWASANFTGCSSVEFNKLADVMDTISGGFQSDLTAQEVLSKLSNATQPTQVPLGSPRVYGGDLVIAVNILVKISEYDREKVSSRDDFDNFAHVASNLLETTNSKTWKELEEAGKDRSKILVKAMDDYGLAVAATLNGSTKPVVAQTQNLLMRIDRVKMDSPGLKIAYKQSSIYLPSQAFSSSEDSSVVTIVFLTLNEVLSLPKESQNDEGNAISPDTTVISSTVNPKLPGVFNKPVKIVLGNTKINTSTESDVIPQGKCVFWRPDESAIWNTSGCRLVPSESNVTMTTCECDHLTIFAALMDPYDSTIGEGDRKALEIISVIGCSISLLAVLITMAVTLFFWRVMKSPRSKVLLNLCTAIAASCTLVIFEGLARNTAGCPVLAALLHYILLALFSWMLCEGVLHYILIVKVFGGGSGTKVRYFCLFAWGCPAVVVAVSLAVTRAKGYGSSGTCWLDVDSGLIWAFIGPALLVISINTVVFIIVMYRMLGTKFIQDKKQIEKVKAGIKASMVILPLLGLTWLFGLLGFSSDTIVFKYMFAILNSLQGLMIFIFHCALNKEIRDAIKRKRARSNTGFTSATLKTRASPSMMRSELALNQLALKNRPNRAQSIDSLSWANSTPEQSPKTSRLMLSAKAKKITPSSSANVTPDQSPKTSVHRLTAHYDDVTSVDVNLVMIVTQPKSSERKQTQRKRSMRSFGKKRQTSTKTKTSHEPLKTLEGSDKGVEDNENGIPSIIERLSAQGNRGSLETSAPDDGMLNQLYGKVGEEYDCHSDEHFAKENNACRSFKPFGTEKETKESEGEILQQQREDIELTVKEGVRKTSHESSFSKEPNKGTECGLVNPACEENSSDSSPNSETGEETTSKDVQPLSSPGKPKKGKKAKKPEQGQVNQGVEGDEDFEPTAKTWDKIRRKISGNSSKGTRHEVLSDETSENEDEHMQNNTSL
ncbi:adhesion G protein-coupled receptor B1-like [Porites lutea]|uniref:adhesion G protein-coupled receptor B1-like n=1 Tax=Porites lutea TaxID=51062 RepID=UPI003CC51215